MKAAHLLPCFILRMRLVRPLVDLAIALAAGTLLAIVLADHQMHVKKQAQAKQSRPLTAKPALKATAKTRPVTLRLSPGDETQLWKNWADWLEAEKPASGYCLLAQERGMQQDMPPQTRHREWRGKVQAAPPDTQLDTQQNTGGFHLECLGLPGSNAFKPMESVKALFDGLLFSNRAKARNVRLRKAPEEWTNESGPSTSSKPNYAIRGWIDTDSGRRHYNPEKRTWQVAP